MDTNPLVQFKNVDVGVLLSFMAEGLIMFDCDGNITVLNPHASLLLDYTTKELIGKNLDDIIKVYHDDKLVEPDQTIVTRVARGEVFTVLKNKTLYFESRGGNKFPVFASAKPMKITEGNICTDGGILVFRDITTEKELEKYKENTAKTLSELTPVLQKTATGDFTFQPVLPEEEDEFTELMVGLRLMLDDLRELDREREKNEREKIAAIQEKQSLTEKYSKQLEKEVDKKTNELSEANLHIEKIIENFTNGLIEYDHNGDIIRLNKAAEEMLGVSKNDILGQRMSIKDKDNRQRSSLVAVSYPDLAEGAVKVDREVSGIDADMHELTIQYPIEREIQVASVPISKAGSDGVYGNLKIIRDVTRERLISRSKSEFISIAAHQLRTPLSAIKWALSLLINGEFGKMTAEQSDMMTETFDTNEKMISLVNDLLNVARIEDGRFGYDFKSSNFNQLITKLIGASKLHATEKQVELVFIDNAEQGLEFVFDPNKMEVAIQNLIDNAIKYTKAEGRVEVTLSKREDFAQVEVKDSGIGVPKSQLNRLFTKFFRAENVTRLPVSGSGLGLFITKNIIVRHGGQIKVDSKEGEGTTFTFSIPTDESLIPAKDDVAASLYTE